MNSGIFKICSLIMFLTVSLNAFSQIKSYGLSGGMNIIPQNKTDVNGTTHNLGWDAGLFADYMFTDNLGVELGLQYCMTRKSYEIVEKSSIDALLGTLIEYAGADSEIDMEMLDTTIVNIITEYANTDMINTTTANVNLSYFKVPLSVVGKLKRVKIHTGAYLGFLLKAETRTSLTQEIPLLEALDVIKDDELARFFIKSMFEGFYEPEFEETTNSSNYQSLDYGMHGGISFHADNGLFFGAQYVHGLTAYYTGSTEGFTTLTNNHSYFKVLMGFDFGKTEVASIMF